MEIVNIIFMKLSLCRKSVETLHSPKTANHVCFRFHFVLCEKSRAAVKFEKKV